LSAFKAVREIIAGFPDFVSHGRHRCLIQFFGSREKKRHTDLLKQKNNFALKVLKGGRHFFVLSHLRVRRYVI